MRFRANIFKAFLVECAGSRNASHAKDFRMTVSNIGTATAAAKMAPSPPESGKSATPDRADDRDSDDVAASVPPVQAATAPGTGQKVDVIA
jgi:hypothetical protein